MAQLDIDVTYMRQALAYADYAEKQGEVPIGAILLFNKQLVVGAYNQTITKCDPTAHAEVLVLKQAASVFRNYRLLNSTLYVTLEPCLMCIGAMLQARIKRLVFGAYNNQRSLLGNLSKLLETTNHSFVFTDGILANECAKKLQQFFLQKRKRRPKSDSLVV